MSSLKETWIKVVEYASKPSHGISRMLRKGYSIEFNCGGAYTGEVYFEIYDTYLRVTADEGEKTANLYIDWEKMTCIKTSNAK